MEILRSLTGVHWTQYPLSALTSTFPALLLKEIN